MEPAGGDPLRETVWGRTPRGQWDGLLRGYRVVVEPPWDGAPLRDHRCVEYAEGSDRSVAGAWADAAARDRGEPPDIAVRVVGQVEFSAHNPLGPGSDSRYRHREGHSFRDVPAAVRDQVLAGDPGVRWIRRNAFQYRVAGSSALVEGAFETGLFALLDRAIDDHGRLFPLAAPARRT